MFQFLLEPFPERIHLKFGKSCTEVMRKMMRRFLAAMLAAANYRETAGMGSVQAFRVGDVSVTPGANSARALRDAAERLMLPFCAGGLSCRGVLG